MDEDQPWELVQEPETGNMPPQGVPQEGAEMRPPKPPDKVALSPDADNAHLSKSKRHHHGHEANSASRRNTGDPADSAVQGTDRARKPKGERLGDAKFYLRPETPHRYAFHSTFPNERLNIMPPSSTNPHFNPQRPQQCRDDVDVVAGTASSSHAQMNVELKLWRENADLRQALDLEKNRAAQAERVAEELRTYSRTKELQLQSSMLAVANDSDALGQEATKLRRENQSLRAELDDARSHIFSLQPYRQELTPKEVEQDFDDLVTSVSEWVQKFADPIVEDEDNFQHAIARARRSPEDVQKLRRFIGNHPDLIHGCLYPETDVDILISVVLRYLNDNIFQKGLPGTVQHLGEAISQIEGSMQSHVEPKRDQFAIRTWRGEAFNAVLCSPDYHVDRKTWMKDLTLNLVAGFKLFRKEKDFVAFCFSCQDAVIKPALRLHEKFLTSTHHFYLDINPHIVWNQQRDLEMSPEFFENLGKLQCDNILQNRKHFNVEKLDPVPTLEDLKATLTNVLTVVPGVYMRQIGKGDAIKPPMVVRKQQVLVAYGSPEKKHKFMDKGGRTLLSYVYFGQKERERTAENPWTAWRHITWG
ncbi:hypothetical protein CONLIGDRAFT_633977 [Coniochaeta ligniaria NRRL 30616]|uniref:Uncharacterized protein n=1 Tax=Coniochaeta ligniaria NRRL 30616 TaxID=1408157 RepID=A0A1J7JJ00_9PEZI|nr:hypothetical protein CONLIGDRAFT_633977 [Coniochaeta ligniaria NRRL 30616]